MIRLCSIFLGSCLLSGCFSMSSLGGSYSSADYGSARKVDSIGYPAANTNNLYFNQVDFHARLDKMAGVDISDGVNLKEAKIIAQNYLNYKGMPCFQEDISITDGVVCWNVGYGERWILTGSSLDNGAAEETQTFMINFQIDKITGKISETSFKFLNDNLEKPIHLRRTNNNREFISQ